MGRAPEEALAEIYEVTFTNTNALHRLFAVCCVVGCRIQQESKWDERAIVRASSGCVLGTYCTQARQLYEICLIAHGKDAHNVHPHLTIYFFFFLSRDVTGRTSTNKINVSALPPGRSCSSSVTEELIGQGDACRMAWHTSLITTLPLVLSVTALRFAFCYR